MEDFYTLKGYELKEKKQITTSMEDYLEMIYRISLGSDVHVKKISTMLNVKESSVSKMINKLKNINLINSKKYGIIYLTDSGFKYAKYLYERHEILTKFFKILNKDSYNLDQVEKIEHFIDEITVSNIKKYLDNNNSML